MKEDLDVLAGLSAIGPGAESPRSADFQPDLDEYARAVIFSSGGKDSLALTLDLLDRGMPRHKIKWHHHDVDGAEGSELFDWPCTHSYVQAVGDALGIKVFFSWEARRAGARDAARKMRHCSDRVYAR
jgi:hypothetical protein